MSRSLEAILADFDALNETEYDFELGCYEGVDRVRQLCDELKQLPEREQALPTLFAVFERMPNADFGAPGALVFTLESMEGSPRELAESLKRQPMSYTLWMANRIINGLYEDGGDQAEQDYWLGVLRAAAEHPLIGDAKEEVLNFLSFQQERRLQEPEN